MFMYFIEHCFICRPSDSTASEIAGIEPRTAATFDNLACCLVLKQAEESGMESGVLSEEGNEV